MLIITLFLLRLLSVYPERRTELTLLSGLFLSSLVMTGMLPAWLLTCYKGSPRLRLAHFLPRDTLLAGVHVLSDSAKWRTARETALYLLSTKLYDTKSTPGQIMLDFCIFGQEMLF